MVEIKTETDRINVIEYLVWIQGDNPKRYEMMTDDALAREYERVWNNLD